MTFGPARSFVLTSDFTGFKGVGLDLDVEVVKVDVEVGPLAFPVHSCDSQEMRIRKGSHQLTLT